MSRSSGSRRRVLQLFWLLVRMVCMLPVFLLVVYAAVAAGAVGRALLRLQRRMFTWSHTVEAWAAVAEARQVLERSKEPVA